MSAAPDMFYSESQYVSTTLHGIKLSHCTVGDNSWHCFSSSPAILSNLSTSHTIMQSCRRNKKKSRGQLKLNIDMLCQTHKHPCSLTSHILYHANCVACKYWSGFHTEREGGGGALEFSLPRHNSPPPHPKKSSMYSFVTGIKQQSCSRLHQERI